MPKTKRNIQKIEIEGVDDIYIRELNAKQFAEVADLLNGLDNTDSTQAANGMAFVCFRSVCDEQGTPIYKNTEEVLEETFSFIEKCTEAALEINGLNADEQLAADVKNS